MAVVEFQQVTKRYTLCDPLRGGIKNFLFRFPQIIRKLRQNKFTALDGVSFSLERGQALAVIGPNGAGKSTMLCLLAGVLLPTEGKVHVGGNVCPLLELGAGFHPDLTGRENISLNGVLLGLTRKQVRQRLGDIIEFSELGDFIDQPVRTYSAGMLGRLGFSVAAHLDMDVLLVDEVLSVGDASFQAKCMDRMHKFMHGGVTTVFVSHDMPAVRALCPDALWLEKGRVRMLGPSGQVVSAYLQSQAESHA